MEQRISRLGQFINEAQWRFQLVSWDNGTNRQIIRSSKKRMNRKLQRIASSDENWKAVAAQDEDSDDALTEGTSGENWEIKRFDRCKHYNSERIFMQISKFLRKKMVPCESIAEEFSSEWSHRRLSSIDSTVRTCLYSAIWLYLDVKKNLLERFHLKGHTDEEVGFKWSRLRPPHFCFFLKSADLLFLT